MLIKMIVINETLKCVYSYVRLVTQHLLPMKDDFSNLLGLKQNFLRLRDFFLKPRSSNIVQHWCNVTK